MRNKAFLRPSWSPPIFALVVVVVYYLVAPDAYRLTLGANIGITAIAAVGLTLAIGGAGQLALGQAGFMAVGAYGTAVLMTNAGIPFLLALVFSIVLTTAGGAGVGYIALRLKGNYLAMATLALGTGIYSILVTYRGWGGANGFSGIEAPSIGSLSIVEPEQQYWLVGCILIVVTVAGAAFVATRPGKELRAIRDDEVAARLSGIHVTRRKVEIFAFCSALGGVAGSLHSAIQTTIDPSLFSPQVSITLFVIVALGGMGSITGAIVATALVNYVTQQITGAGQYAAIALGAIAIFLMAVLPGGLAAMPKRIYGRLRRAPVPSSSIELDTGIELEEISS